MTDAASPTLAQATDAHAHGGRIIEHYRLDATPRLARALGIGAAGMAIGSLLVALALVLPAVDPRADLGVTRRPMGAVDEDGNPLVDPTPYNELWFGLFGLSCIVIGGGTSLLRLQRILREDSYVALRTDGAFFQADARCELISWGDVERVRYDATSDAVRFECHDGTVWLREERYFGITGADLAKRASEVRRKALFGLL